MKRLRWRRAALILALALLGVTGGLLWRAHTGFARGKKLLSFELWPDARVELGRYLWLHPSDAHARVMIAEALIKDDTLPADVAIGSALHHLQIVPDDSDYAAMARCQEGRIELFLLNRPARAERLFRHAIEVNSKAIDPHFMIWKLYDLTGRSHLAEAEFWRVYEISSPLERGLRLREWYMSQFYPATANPTLDRMMGVSDRDANAAKTEGQRFIRFRDSEPDGAAGYAALARWFQHEGDSQFALQVLDDGIKRAEDWKASPFFLATRVNALIELGEFEKAELTFAKWPESTKRGYEYWLTCGMIMHEVRGEIDEAIKAYDGALAVWPGPVDWRTMNRKVSCLQRLRRTDEATALRERIKKVEDATNDELHRKLRKALGALDEPDKLQPVIDFYDQIGRKLEADGWREFVSFARTRSEAK